MLRCHTGRHSLSLHKPPHFRAIAGILVSLVAQPNTISLTSVQLAILLHLIPTPENAQQFQWLEFQIRFFRTFLDRVFPLCLTLSVCLRGIKMSVENTHVLWRPLCTVKGWSTTRMEYPKEQSFQGFVVQSFPLVLTLSQASWGHAGLEGQLCCGGCHLDDEVSNFSVPHEIPRSEWSVGTEYGKQEWVTGWMECSCCGSSLWLCIGAPCLIALSGGGKPSEACFFFF